MSKCTESLPERNPHARGSVGCLTAEPDRIGQADRTIIQAPVLLRGGLAGVRGIACDVSEGGIKVATDSPLELGPVSVKLVGLPSVSGEICWRTPRHVGVRLSAPLHPDVLASWIKYHGDGRP